MSALRRGVFITATDTNAGKTFIGAGITAALHQQGLTVTPRKPIESGCQQRGDLLWPADGQCYADAINNSAALNTITPPQHRLQHALSPVRAAQLVGKTFYLDQLEHAVLADTEQSELIIAEGAGGFYSPLAFDGLNADLAQRLQWPVILVAEDKLGCQNHILLSLKAIKDAGLATLAVVLNNGNNTESIYNHDDLEQRLDIPVISIPALDKQAYAPAMVLMDILPLLR